MLTRLLKGAAATASTMAVAALALLAAITVLDVGGRYLFNKPLFGAVEISEFLMVILGFGGLALAELRNGHITVDFFITSLPPRLQALLGAVGALLSVVFWSFVAWRAAVHANRVADAGEVSANWLLPTYPFYLAVTLGSGLFALVLIARVVRGVRIGFGPWTPPPSA
jgi:TRAP-type transport system small permease protein